MLLPSLQTVNVFPLLLATFLSRVLVADFPPDLLQKPFFKLVGVIKHIGTWGQERREQVRGGYPHLHADVCTCVPQGGSDVDAFCPTHCTCECASCPCTLVRGSLLGKFTPSLTRSFFSSSLRTSSPGEYWAIRCVCKTDGRNNPVRVVCF